MSDHYADKVMRDALMRATGDLDLDLASQAIQNALEALHKQSIALKNLSYHRKPPDAVARAFSHTGKTLDELFRLVKFSKGQPDSRPDFGTDWLQALTDKQFSQVKTWIEENERTDAEKEAEMDEDEAHDRG